MTRASITDIWMKEWVECVMNQTVVGLYPKDKGFDLVWGLELCWYLIGEGVIVWREGDGRSPVEPTVPGDHRGQQNLHSSFRAERW